MKKFRVISKIVKTYSIEIEANEKANAISIALMTDLEDWTPEGDSDETEAQEIE